jgi:hypothetical protein
MSRRAHLIIGFCQHDISEFLGSQGAVYITGLQEVHQPIVEAIIVTENERNCLLPAHKHAAVGSV